MNIHDYPFTVHLDRCNGSFNTLDDPSRCVPNKIEEVNLNVFNKITKINESKTLTKHISCECQYKFDGRKFNSNQKRYNNKCRCMCKNLKNHQVYKKIYLES